MRKFTRYGLAAGMAAALAWGLAGCGGQSDGTQNPKISYSTVVSFGDSLSDAGAYKVGQIDTGGGGLFTVNGTVGAVGSEPVPSYTWAQLVSAAAVGKVSCAARTGGFGVPTAQVAGCTNYAQGGSRVTNPQGTGNNGFTTVSGVSVGNAALTEPVVAQVTNYLKSMPNGQFAGTELVTVQGGANELFAQAKFLTAAASEEGSKAGTATFNSTLVSLLARGATNPTTAATAIATAMAIEAGNGGTPNSIVAAGVTAAVMAGNTAVAAPAASAAIVASAQSAAVAAGNAAGAQYAATTGAGIAVAAVTAAAGELSASVKDMVSKGAKHVVVTNLPDVSLTPYALSTITVTNGVTDTSTQQLILAMTTAFNNKLKADLAGVANVLFVDVFTENQKQIATPSQFGLSNVKDVACNLNYGVNLLATKGNADGSSLVCKPSNLIAGDTSRYLFADSVHPTPYGHKLLAQLVTKELVLAGWL